MLAAIMQAYCTGNTLQLLKIESRKKRLINKRYEKIYHKHITFQSGTTHKRYLF
ncbi:hypothetical protein JCM16496A_28250 [Bacteroides rodentium JCM 16496]